jgi:hypothetical protein
MYRMNIRAFGAGIIVIAVLFSSTVQAAGRDRLKGNVNNSGLSATKILKINKGMSLANEIIPKGLSPQSAWSKGAVVTMGVEPYGTSLPDWWPGIRPEEWHAMTPWFVIYPPVEGSPTHNARVEILGLEFWAYITSTNRWVLLDQGGQPTWMGLYNLSGGGRTGAALEQSPSPEGGVIVAPVNDMMIHGGLRQIDVPWGVNGADISALMFIVRHRAVLDNPLLSDDRPLLRHGVSAGIDYYPWLGAKVKDLNAEYAPAAAKSRFERVTPEWRETGVLVYKDDLNLKRSVLSR